MSKATFLALFAAHSALALSPEPQIPGTQTAAAATGASGRPTAASGLPPAPTSVSTSPGTRVVGQWQAWFLGSRTQLVLVRNTAHERAIPSLQALRQDASILRKLYFEKHSDFLYFGEQPALELAIDEACKLAQAAPPKLSMRAAETALVEFVDPAFAKDFLTRHGDYGPFLGGSLFTAVVPPGVLQASGANRLTIAAAIASCKDPRGQRFKVAQQRAFHFHMRDNLWALRDAISHYINTKMLDSAFVATPDSPQAEAIKAQALRIAMKACRLTLDRLREYDRWLGAAGNAKRMQTEVQFDAPIAEDTKWYSSSSIERVEKQLSTLQREYEAGAQKSPEQYPALTDGETLVEADFKVLFGP